MQSRRILIVALLSVVSAGAVAQQGGGPFVGTWKGDLPGIGETTLVIASVGGDGRVEGRMEFTLKGFVSTFGDRADAVKRTNQRTVS